MKPRSKQPPKRTPGSRVTCQAKARPKLSGDEQMAKLRRELRAEKKRAAIAEVDRAADAQIIKNVETELTNLLGLIPPIGVLFELKRLCSEVLATRETIKLATGRIGEALGDTAGPPATTGRMLNMIERLISAQRFAAGRSQAMAKLINELTADRDVANDLIARLAFNLTRGPDQERIENAPPAEHRAIVEAEVPKLVELSLKLEMAEPRFAAQGDAAERARTAEARWERLYCRMYRDVADILGQDPGTGSELIGCLEVEFKRLKERASASSPSAQEDAAPKLQRPSLKPVYWGPADERCPAWPELNLAVPCVCRDGCGACDGCGQFLADHLRGRRRQADVVVAALKAAPPAADFVTKQDFNGTKAASVSLRKKLAELLDCDTHDASILTAAEQLHARARDAEEDCAELAGVANHYAPDNLIEVELVRLTPRTNETLTGDDLKALFAAHCECRPLDLARADDDHSHDCDTAILRDAQRAMGFVGTPEQHLADIRAGDDAEKARIRCVEHWNRDVESEIYAPRLATALTNP